jgi:hypothetical protein
LTVELKRSLRPIEPEGIPERHPIRLFLSAYERERRRIGLSRLPDPEPILGCLDGGIINYRILLEPVCGRPCLDFIPLDKGSKVPGIGSTRILRGELYTHGIAPRLADERVMELAGSIILKTHRLTEGLSARNKTLTVRVFRGVFPVWQKERQKPAVLLFIAPPYAEVGQEPNLRLQA